MINDDDSADVGDYISHIQCLECGAKLPFAVLLVSPPKCPECKTVFGRSIFDEPLRAIVKLPNA